jgi:chitin disaccharide deacetylase
MVFMQDSSGPRSSQKIKEMDGRLHFNFSEEFTDGRCPRRLGDNQGRIVRFLRRNSYSQLLYNPSLRRAFFYSYHAQMEEFIRLFGKQPSHIDGHHHMHLCANLLLSKSIPAGMRLRRNFSFWPGEKGFLNRAYRGLVDRWLARRYRLADYFFDLTQCIEGKKLDRVAALAKSSNVELMTHPTVSAEKAFLMSDEFQVILQHLEIGGYALV